MLAVHNEYRLVPVANAPVLPRASKLLKINKVDYMEDQTHKGLRVTDSNVAPAAPVTAADEIARAILTSREQMYAGRIALESALAEARSRNASGDEPTQAQHSTYGEPTPYAAQIKPI